MVKKCYGWIGTDGGGNVVRFTACARSPGWTYNPYWWFFGDGQWFYPTDGGTILTSPYYGAKPISLTELPTDEALTAWASGQGYEGGCGECLIPWITHCEKDNKSRVIVGVKEYKFDSLIETKYQEERLIIKSKNKQFEISTSANGYKIACGDECPPDHIKCKHNGYPGYCCIPCSSTAEKINALARRLRNG